MLDNSEVEYITLSQLRNELWKVASTKNIVDNQAYVTLFYGDTVQVINIDTEKSVEKLLLALHLEKRIQKNMEYWTNIRKGTLDAIAKGREDFHRNKNK